MAEGVVELLEVINIKDQQRKGTPAFIGRLKCIGQVQVECAAALQAGQRIA